MPKYAKPLKGGSHVRRFSHFTPVAGATTTSSSTSIENLSKAASTVGAGPGGGSISGEKISSNRLLLPVNCQKLFELSRRLKISSVAALEGNIFLLITYALDM